MMKPHEIRQALCDAHTIGHRAATANAETKACNRRRMAIALREGRRLGAMPPPPNL